MKMKTPLFNVSVADSHVEEIDSVARECRQNGLVVLGVVPSIGLIAGTTSQRDIGKLRRICGVAGIARKFDIPIQEPMHS